MLPKYIRNTNKPWTMSGENKIIQLARKNTPTRVIGLLTGRTENAIRNRAARLGVSLKPANQRPYGNR